jgi:phosphonate transport system substrate-binding protein
MPVKAIVSLLLLFLLFASTPCSATDKGLTLWIHPYLPATELIRRFSPLVAYLSKAIDRPVNIRVQKSYQAHLDFIGRDLADIAYVGPANYVHVTDQYGHKPLLAKLEVEGKPFFHGVIITRQDSSILTLADLAGKSFAFGDPNSTMSHEVPRAVMTAAGVGVDQLAYHDYLGSHHDVALAVLGGYFDAGAVKEEVFHAFQKRGLKALARTPPIPPHLFLTRADLPPDLVARLRAALLAINTMPDKENILAVMEDSATGLLPVTDNDYRVLRSIMEEIK